MSGESGDGQDAEKIPCTLDIYRSFIFEVFILVSLILATVHFIRMRRKIHYLTDSKTAAKLEEICAPPRTAGPDDRQRQSTRKASASVKAKAKDYNAGLKSVLSARVAESHEQLAAAKEEADGRKNIEKEDAEAGVAPSAEEASGTGTKKTAKELRKDALDAWLHDEAARLEKNERDLENNKNFVGCEHFRDHRRIFYAGALSFQVFQALTYPSLEEVPALIMLLLLCGLYPIRRAHPKSFGALSFFMIYFL